MAYLLGITVTPVQRFIREARRTQDIWSGSLLLSLMSYEMVQVLKKHRPDAEIIFPYLAPESSKQEVPPAVTNEVCAKIDLEQDQAVTLAVTIEEEVQNWWQQQVAGQVREKLLDIGIFAESELSLWKEQIANQFRIAWAIYPLDSDNLKVSYQELNRLLSAAKQTRLIIGYQGNNRTKCTLNGDLEVMGSDDSADFWGVKLAERLKQAKTIDATAIRARMDTDGRERLCAISLTKRLAPAFVFAPKYNWHLNDTRSPLRFPSTTAIAWSPHKKLIVECIAQANPEHQIAFKNLLFQFAERVRYCAKVSNEIEGKHWLPWFTKSLELFPVQPHLKAVRPLRAAIQRFLSLDGVWLNPPDPNEIPLEGRKVNRSNIKKKYKGLANILTQLKKLLADDAIELERTPPLTIIRADADHLGEKLGKAMQQDLQQAQRLSKLLAENVMSRVVKAVEAQYQGYVIFAGGDECLALVPAIHTLDAAESIACAYQQAGQEGDFPDLTCSIAAVVASPHRPLRQTVEEVGNLLSEAKNYKRRFYWQDKNPPGDRHAFGLAVIPGSGNVKRGVIGLELADWHEHNYRQGKPIRAITDILQPFCELLTIPSASGILVSTKLFREWLALFSNSGGNITDTMNNSWVGVLKKFYPKEKNKDTNGILIAELARLIGRHIQVSEHVTIQQLTENNMGDQSVAEWLQKFLDSPLPANDPDPKALAQALRGPNGLLSTAIIRRITALMNSGDGKDRELSWSKVSALLLAITTLGTRETLT